MKEIKNKIIALSGEPVTGKGTNVKALISKLEKMGYKEENIHLESTGKDFRKYFNSIIEFIRNIDDDKKLKELSELEELKEILDNEEYRKVFIEIISNLKKSNIDFSGFTIEQANNMNELAGIRKIVDTLIDEGMKKKGKIINAEEKPEDIWIIDSRLAFANIPEAFSVRLTSNPDVAGERLFQDSERGAEDSKYQTVEEAKMEREKRRIGENERYKDRYGIDLGDPENYDLIIDTSYSTIDDISDTILICFDKFMEGKQFGKNWTSPKTLLPMQGERETYGKASLDFGEMIESIKNYGYIPSEEIEILEVDGLKYIYEGHHRNFAAGYLGKTLVPFTTIAKDDEMIPGYKQTARQRSKGLSLNYLFGHEDMIAHSDKEFSYNKIYPGIYKSLREENER